MPAHISDAELERLARENPKLLEIGLYGEFAGDGQEIRTVSSTGGRKGRKIERVGLIPPKALLELARHYGVGAEKYTERDESGKITHSGDNNWRLGYDWSLSIDSLQRHTLQFIAGEDYDPETGSKHMIAAAWHCLALATFMDEHPEFDDRWKGQPA